MVTRLLAYDTTDPNGVNGKGGQSLTVSCRSGTYRDSTAIVGSQCHRCQPGGEDRRRYQYHPICASPSGAWRETTAIVGSH